TRKPGPESAFEKIRACFLGFFFSFKKSCHVYKFKVMGLEKFNSPIEMKAPHVSEPLMPQFL
ncbi:MAG: hypothetical protein PUJ11_02610, partial [Eubacteriaceae bacterium]|nr:hypothetical protein [Eubacteriaceae bacterium]